MSLTPRRILLLVASLLAVWGALQFLVWPAAQPWYSAAVTRTADLALGLLEHGGRVTHLKADGARIHVFSDLSEQAGPSTSYDANVMHFYIVLLASVILVFPALKPRRRAILLAGSMIGMFLFHVLAVLINVEHLYAVEMASVSERNYTDVERAVWSWTSYAVDYFAMDLLPAAALVLLVVARGGLGRQGPADARGPAAEKEGLAQGARGSSDARAAARAAPRATAALAAAAAVVVLALPGALLWHHLGRVHARQAEKECMLGYRALAANGWTEAAARFSAALERNPGMAPAHEGLGQARMRQGQIDEAASEFREAMAIEPGNPLGHLHLGNALFAMSKFDDAAAEFEAALALQPGQREALFDLAMALKKLGRRDEAEASLRRALEVSPDFADAMFELSVSMITANRACGARPYLARLVAMEPSSKRGVLAAQTIEDLKTRCGGT